MTASTGIPLACAVAAWLILVVNPALAASGGRALSSSGVEPAATVVQFTSGGHVLGFGGSGYFVSNGTYVLSVQFEGATQNTLLLDDSAFGEKARPLVRLSYSGIWPGIGVTYDAPRGGIARSTWTIAAGADPAAIRLRYNGPVEVTASGDLGLRFETGWITETRPVAWQVINGQRHPVQVGFDRLAPDLVGFRVGPYRKDVALVIDPTLTWNTFLGGSGYEEGGDIAVDDDGNVYVSGRSGSSWGSPVRAFSGTYDVFAAKLSPSGELVWNTFLGGSGDEQSGDIAVDAVGNVYVGGRSSVRSGTSETPWGEPVRAFSGYGIDAFAAKLNSSGGLVWNTFLGGSGEEEEWDIAVDGGGNVYVTGRSSEGWGAPIRTFAEPHDAFAVKLASSGGVIWNTFLGGSGHDQGSGIAVDASGDVYVTGYSSDSWGNPVRAYTANPNDPVDAFAAKLSSAGALVWNTFLGGYANDYGSDIDIDGFGNIYVTGNSWNTWGEPVQTYSGNGDAFVAKLSSDGVKTWHTFFGGSGHDYGSAIAVDDQGKCYVGGQSDAAWGSPVSPFTAGRNSMMTALTSAGAVVWNSFLGGSDRDYASGIEVGGNGDVYVAGSSRGSWGSPVRAHTPGTESHYMDVFAARIIDSVAAATCGDGRTEDAEQCDDGNTASGDCCGANCAFEASTVTCRASIGICDMAEFCTGSTSICPGDTFAPSGTICRPAGGTCDAAEACVGSAVGCPSDAKRPFGSPCGDAFDTDCTDPDSCDGSGNCRPNNASSGAACGDPADSDCTRPDTCDGGGTCRRNDAVPGTACHDNDVCTDGDFCGATGSCNGGGMLDCNDANICTQDSCDPNAGCVNAQVPRATREEGGTCRIANSTAMSIRIAADGSGTIKWKWLSGQASTIDDFGLPHAGTTYSMCIYDSAGNIPFLPLPGLGEANDGKQVGPGSNWELADENSGWKYKNMSCDEEGIAVATLVPGDDGAARITLKGKGQCNAVPVPCHDAGAALPCSGKYFHMDPSVVVQLVSDHTTLDPVGECWHSAFGDENTVLKNAPQKFKSKRHVRVPLP